MAQPPPRHRHGRHHRGTGSQRRHGQDAVQARPQAASLANNSNNLTPTPLSSQEKQELRQTLVQIHQQCKTIANKSKYDDSTALEHSPVPADFSKNAQEKLLVACQGFSTLDAEDVTEISAVTFSLFNSDLLNATSSAGLYQELVDSLCAYFVMSFRNYQNSGETLPLEQPGKGQVDILRALSAVLFENGAIVKDRFTDLFEVITGVCSGQRQPTSSNSSELRRMALNCMANLVHKTGSLFASMHDKMYDILYSSLTDTSLNTESMVILSSTIRRKDRAAERKLNSSALRALHFLLQEDKQLTVRSITPIMDVICKYMFFTSEHGSAQPRTTTTSSAATVNAISVGILKRQSYIPPTSNSPMSKLPGQNTVGNQYPNVDPDQSYISYRSVQSSDSEYSDTESGIHLIQRRQHDGKVRLNALLCLQALARAAPKQLQPHWAKFLTTSNTPATLYFGSRKTPSLVAIIGTDPIPTVRSAACVVLSSIMESSKQYLAMAEEKVATYSGLRSQTGTLALSERVGLMTRELHVNLATAIGGMDDSLDHTAATQMLKCCSSVVASCSYERMRPGLPLLLFNVVSRFVNHTDPGLQIAALSFMTSLLGNTTSSNQVRSSVLTEPTAADSSSSTAVTTSGLHLTLLQCVSDRQTSVLVRIEAWCALRALAQHQYEVAHAIWPQLDRALAADQRTEDLRLRSAGLLFLDEYLKAAMLTQTPLDAEGWKDILEGHLLQAFGEDNATIKALGCDCISHISSASYEGLPSRLQMLILSLILATAQDDSPGTRSSTCRAIGVFILFPFFKEDSAHFLDMATTVLDLCRDPNLGVRVRASWAVGNLCDSLVLLKASIDSSNDSTTEASAASLAVLEEILTLPTWTRIMGTAIVVSQDHDKLKSNGIRAIGGLLRVTFEGILERERHSLVKDAVNILVKNIEQGPLKSRWNACYAVQNVLLNPDFPIGSTFGTSYACDADEVSWTDQVYSTLLQAIQQSRNFKVRINACAALTVPKTRANYGNQARFKNLIKGVLKAVANLDNKDGVSIGSYSGASAAAAEQPEYGEFQYRDQLELKLLRCLDHLLQLAVTAPSSSGSPPLLGIEIDTAMKQRIVNSRNGVIS